MDDNYYMNLAIKEAEKAVDIGEVPVGAIIIDSNEQIIGYGFNSPISTNDPTSHAEINALRIAARTSGNYRLVDTTLYTTIEPCIMCMGAIIHARLNRVVFGAHDPKWGGAGSLYNFADDLRLNHRIECVSGVLEDECRNLIQNFFRSRRLKESS